GDAFREGDDDLVSDRREGRVVGVAEDVLGGLVPDVLEEAGLDGAAPHVLVDREGVVLRGRDRQALALGVLDGLVTGEREVADGGDALQLGGERGDRDLEADLIVALAGAAVGDGGRAVLLRGLHQVLGDDGAGDRRDVRVGVHVQRVRLEGGHAVLVGELVAGVGDVGLDGAAVQGALADDLEVLSALAHVDRAGDDVGAGGVVDPADGHRGVEAAGVGEDDLLCHGVLLGRWQGRRGGAARGRGRLLAEPVVRGWVVRVRGPGAGPARGGPRRGPAGARRAGHHRRGRGRPAAPCRPRRSYRGRPASPNGPLWRRDTAHH